MKCYTDMKNDAESMKHEYDLFKKGKPACFYSK